MESMLIENNPYNIAERLSLVRAEKPYTWSDGRRGLLSTSFGVEGLLNEMARLQDAR